MVVMGDVLLEAVASRDRGNAMGSFDIQPGTTSFMEESPSVIYAPHMKGTDQRSQGGRAP